MPELPEVRTVSKFLNQKLKNKTIKTAKVNLEKIIKNSSKSSFISKVKNKKILKIDNEGKWIIFHLEDDYTMIVHLRLEGKFRTTFEGQNPKHDHIVFEFTDGTKLYFNDTRQFGTFHVFKGDYKNQKPISNLGEEPQNIDIDSFYNKMQRKTIAIKTAMLDQTLVVGLGNIYINEVLWQLKINPSTPSNKISKKTLKSILDESFRIMEDSFKLGGSTIKSYVSLDDKEGSFQNFLNVHGKEGNDCKHCGTKIAKYKVNGRGTYYCPKCQK